MVLKEVFCGNRLAGLWKTRRPRSFQTVSAASAGSGHLCPILTFARYNVGVAFVIREFKAEDFDMLWRMDQECFPPGIAYSKAELKAYVRHRGSFTLVAESGAASGNEAAAAAGFIVAHGGPAGHVITIDVIPSARRSGVGSLLLLAAEERLRAAGSRAVGLETAVDNLAALKFYKRHGYNVIRTWPRYYPNGVDALVMKKELT
jgi:ribosomal-protein-alanine N-acetyltransferase